MQMRIKVVVNPCVYFIAILFIFLISACGNSKQNAVINAKIKGVGGQWVFLREAGHDKIVTIDSTKADDKGAFEFEFECLEPRFVFLQVNDVPNPVILLTEAREQIVVKGEKDNLSRNYEVHGSKGSGLVRELNQRFENVVYTIDTLSRVFRSSQQHTRFDSIKTVIDNVYDVTLDNHRQFTINFVKQNCYSLASVLALYQQYDSRNHVLNSRKDFELFQLVDSTLFPLYPNNALVENLHQNVQMIAKQLKLYDKREDMLNEGQMLPSIMFPLLNGDTIALFDARARYILIDFWALWCDDCQKNFSGLKEVHKKYSPKGFQILQVSLDKDLPQLQKWYERDSIPWMIAADLLQWDSPILDSLSINSIPSNYLVSRRGEILARNVNLRELDEMLAKMLR